MLLLIECVIMGMYVNLVNGELYDGFNGEYYVIFELIFLCWMDQLGNQILFGGGKVILDENGYFLESVVCMDVVGVFFESGCLWCLKQFVGGEWVEVVFEVFVGSGFFDIMDIFLVDVCGVDYVFVLGIFGFFGFLGVEGFFVYEVVVENGFVGIEEEWLVFFVGFLGELGLSGGMDIGIFVGGSVDLNLLNLLVVDINLFKGQIVDYLVDLVIVMLVEIISVIMVELDIVVQMCIIIWFLMDVDQNVYQQVVCLILEDWWQFFVIGMVGQSDGEIFFVQFFFIIVCNLVNQFYDLMDFIGVFNILGNVILLNGVNFFLDYLVGLVFLCGWNYFDGFIQMFNLYIVIMFGSIFVLWVYILCSIDVYVLMGMMILDVFYYDDNGMFSFIGGGVNCSFVYWFWIFLMNDGLEIYFFQYGQIIYLLFDNVVFVVFIENFVVNFDLVGNGILLYLFVVMCFVINFFDFFQVQFIQVGKFGFGVSGGVFVDLSGYVQFMGVIFIGQIVIQGVVDVDVVQFLCMIVNMNDQWCCFIFGEMQWGLGFGLMDIFFKCFGVGLLVFINIDFLVGQEGVKLYRFCQFGGLFDLDVFGVDFFLLVFELVNFLGEQYMYFCLEFGEFMVYVFGKWVFGDGLFDGIGYMLDGVVNQVGFFGVMFVGCFMVIGDRIIGEVFQSLLDGLEVFGLFMDILIVGLVVVEIVNGEFGFDVIFLVVDVGVVDIMEKGVVGGVVILGFDGKVFLVQFFIDVVIFVNGEIGVVILSVVDVGVVDMIEKGVVNGVVIFDGIGKVFLVQFFMVFVILVNGEIGVVVFDVVDVGVLIQVQVDGLYMVQDLLWINVIDYGVIGDGIIDDVLVLNVIFDIFLVGSVVMLFLKLYVIDELIVVLFGKMLMGLCLDLMMVIGLYEFNVQIKLLVIFMGVVVICFLDVIDGGYVDIFGEQRVLNIIFDGLDVVFGVDGIQVKGNIQNVVFWDVMIWCFLNFGIYCGFQSGDVLYFWCMYCVMFDNNQVYGFFGECMVDLIVMDCQVIGNFFNGWMFQNVVNLQMVGCCVEWNGNYGFYLSGDWGNGVGFGGMLMLGCLIDCNGFNGVYIDFIGIFFIVIFNFMICCDGCNGGMGGGGYVGVVVNVFIMFVIIGDWMNFFGVDDGGGLMNFLQYVGLFIGFIYVQIDNFYLYVVMVVVNDGGGNMVLCIGYDVIYVVGMISIFICSFVLSYDIVVVVFDFCFKSGVNFVCIGINDYFVIQVVIDLVDVVFGKGWVWLLDGMFNLGDIINWFDGVGLGLVGFGWGIVFRLVNGVDDNVIIFFGVEM